MYDFCFTPFYAALLALGGIIGFVATGSFVSLGLGVGAAAALSALTYSSYRLGYKRRTHFKPPVAAQLFIAAALAVIMYQRWAATGKVHIAAGALVSAGMAAYYVWNLTLFAPHYKRAE